MEHKPRTPEETYGPALEKAREALLEVDPVRQATHAGVSFEALDGRAGRFLVPFFGTTYAVSWPAGEVRRENDGSEATWPAAGWPGPEKRRRSPGHRASCERQSSGRPWLFRRP